MNQTLFEAKLITHKNDPPTSREAAEKMIKTGKLNRQENEVWVTILYDYEHFTVPYIYSFTAKELSKLYHLDYHLIQRRLSGLYRKGYIVRTGEKRGGCAVWKLK